MYVHIGGEYTIPVKMIVSLIDLDSVSPNQKDMKLFLNEQDKMNCLEYVSEELSRSLIITTHHVYVSPISVTTLQKRILEGVDLLKKQA
ncbi:MAG TPA: DUF370 domain-containing protein [Bacillota bacterium]|nr:DUF370 domain-containing protein [Bacillota bacterium]